MLGNIVRGIRNFIMEGLVNFFVGLKLMKKPSIRHCSDNGLLPSVLVKTPSKAIKKILNLPAFEHSTQLNQDIFSLLVNQFRPGYFLEIGANDGFTLSNTVYLERCFDWKGILVEANKKYMSSLLDRTNSKVFNVAVSNDKGEAEFIDAGLYGGLKSSMTSERSYYTKDAACITVSCMSLKEILDSADAPDTIDFISIDVEGGEVSIVEQLVSVDNRFKCGCIEHNNRKKDKNDIVNLLKSTGYNIIWEGQTSHDVFFVDSDCQLPIS